MKDYRGVIIDPESIVLQSRLKQPYSYKRVFNLCWWHSFSYILYDGDNILAVNNKDAKSITYALNAAYSQGWIDSYMFNNIE